jgi:hypothetical protein
MALAKASGVRMISASEQISGLQIPSGLSKNADKPRGRAGGIVGIMTGGETMIRLKAMKAKDNERTLKEELLMRLTKDGQFH